MCRPRDSVKKYRSGWLNKQAPVFVLLGEEYSTWGAWVLALGLGLALSWHALALVTLWLTAELWLVWNSSFSASQAWRGGKSFSWKALN